ncbi:hypothetical protein GPK34_00290 [Secundilactobacillus kimchicus]|uniref:hypothetical protein n=1 Tax=Secundilactobacillus kimchicus TaxID=528209 RepID=UPI001C02DBC6|nr:hypothetical protein [Secundilactobacillus kimchicus]MBT9670475.1 hypothetical protein [Secundilactobacillus kimchicus]
MKPFKKKVKNFAEFLWVLINIFVSALLAVVFAGVALVLMVAVIALPTAILAIGMPSLFLIFTYLLGTIWALYGFYLLGALVTKVVQVISNGWKKVMLHFRKKQQDTSHR